MQEKRFKTKGKQETFIFFMKVVSVITYLFFLGTKKFVFILYNAIRLNSKR